MSELYFEENTAASKDISYFKVDFNSRAIACILQEVKLEAADLEEITSGASPHAILFQYIVFV